MKIDKKILKNYLKWKQNMSINKNKDLIKKSIKTRNNNKLFENNKIII